MGGLRARLSLSLQTAPLFLRELHPDIVDSTYMLLDVIQCELVGT